MAHVEYDAEARSIYVTLREGEVARTRALDDYRVVDYDAEGRVIGVELILIDDHPVDFTGLEEGEAVRAAIAAAHGATALPV